MDGCTATRTGDTTPAPDTAWGAFSDEAPWVLDPDALAWRAPADAARQNGPGRGAAAGAARRLPPGRRGLTVSARLATAVGPWAARRWWRRRRNRPVGSAATADLSRRLRLAAEALGPTYIKLGQIISSGEGLFPPELVERVQALPRPGAGRAVRRRARRRSRRTSGGRSTSVFAAFDRRAAGRGVDRPGARRHACAPARTVVVKVQRPTVARLVARRPARRWRGSPRTSSAASRSPRWPTRRRWSSCSPRRSSRSSTSASRRRTCSTSPRCCATSASAATSCPARTPTLVTRRVLVMERLDGFTFDDVAGMRGRRHRHRGAWCAPAMIALHRGRDAPRRLPRRPARRQPVRAARRAHRAARLRHHRPPRRATAGWRSCA